MVAGHMVANFLSENITQTTFRLYRSGELVCVVITQNYEGISSF